MRQYEVNFSVYTNAAGTIGAANLCPARTIVTAANEAVARSMIQAQYASFPRVSIISVRLVR